MPWCHSTMSSYFRKNRKHLPQYIRPSATGGVKKTVLLWVNFPSVLLTIPISCDWVRRGLPVVRSPSDSQPVWVTLGLCGDSCVPYRTAGSETVHSINNDVRHRITIQLFPTINVINTYIDNQEKKPHSSLIQGKEKMVVALGVYFTWKFCQCCTVKNICLLKKKTHKQVHINMYQFQKAKKLNNYVSDK